MNNRNQSKNSVHCVLCRLLVRQHEASVAGLDGAVVVVVERLDGDASVLVGAHRHALAIGVHLKGIAVIKHFRHEVAPSY